ncbi:unnamed protein product [Ectocarpus fasciculatus]
MPAGGHRSTLIPNLATSATFDRLLLSEVCTEHNKFLTAIMTPKHRCEHQQRLCGRRRRSLHVITNTAFPSSNNVCRLLSLAAIQMNTHNTTSWSPTIPSKPTAVRNVSMYATEQTQELRVRLKSWWLTEQRRWPGQHGSRGPLFYPDLGATDRSIPRVLPKRSDITPMFYTIATTTTTSPSAIVETALT